MSLSASDDARAGIPVKREPYPEGEDGIQKSLSEIARMVFEGSGTAAMKSFAGNVLVQAGKPEGVYKRASTLLDFVRANVMYAPDALGHEVIESAAVLLCVEGAPVCIPISDCDGLVCALATLCAASGMRVMLVRQFFGEEHQQHVLCEVEDERGDWIPLDPSTKYPAGKKAPAVRETRVDPLDGHDSARYVGIGGLPVMDWEQGSWQKHDPSKGLGHPSARGDSTWYRVESRLSAGLPLLPEQVTFYANEWYYKDTDGAVFKHACCDDCAQSAAKKTCSSCGPSNALEAEIGVGVSEGTKSMPAAIRGPASKGSESFRRWQEKMHKEGLGAAPQFPGWTHVGAVTQPVANALNAAPASSKMGGVWIWRQATVGDHTYGMATTTGVSPDVWSGTVDPFNAAQFYVWTGPYTVHGGSPVTGLTPSRASHLVQSAMLHGVPA